MQTSHADHSLVPPLVSIPPAFNAAHDLLSRHAQRGQKTAFLDAASGEQLTYRELEDQAHHFANALRGAGFAPESRMMVAMLDTPRGPVVFLGCVLAGVVPVAVNTLLTTTDFDFMLRDSRAQGLVVSKALLSAFEPLLGHIDTLRTVVINGGYDSVSNRSIDHMIRAQTATKKIANTCGDDICFWLYSRGSSGTPQGTVHLHSHLIQTAELYGGGVLGLAESDVVYSAAKLFFAYGLVNALTFPLCVGATTVLWPARHTPDDVFRVLQQCQPTIFYGVPTLYAAMLSHPGRPARSALHLRVGTSAGEALPADIGRRWTLEYGCEVLDGVGSTEMLHIFLSDRPGQVRRAPPLCRRMDQKRRQVHGRWRRLPRCRSAGQAESLLGAQGRPRRHRGRPASPRQGAAGAYKYPRWIEFVGELPKTATGKIQRYRLRQRDFGI